MFIWENENLVKGILDPTKKDVITDGYGSLTVLKIVICLFKKFVDDAVRLKGSGIPCLQSCF